MLQYSTIDTKTLEFLKKLQKVPDFSNLRLVGGTALALQLGHRKSIDIDLFGKIDSDELAISKELDKIGSVTRLKKSENINIYTINGIKVDIVNYHYKWLEKPIIEDNLILADKKDIAAMKLSAITGRGLKKDFIDLFFLLKHYNLKQMLGFYNQKYYDGSIFMVLKSLSYFDDANNDESPVMLKQENWENIKEYIRNALKLYFVR
jgi:hypothetical protein